MTILIKQSPKIAIIDVVLLGEKDKVVTQLKELIDSNVLEKSDTYYRIAFDRGYTIVENTFKHGKYELRIAFRSDSEMILTAYEKNNDIKISDFLTLPLEQGCKKSIKSFMIENPAATTLDFMNKFTIFSYPHFMPIATSDSQKELEEVFELLKAFRGMVLDDVIDLSDSQYNFMTNNKRKRKKDEENRPGCFDGLCIEKNIDKIFPFSREVY